ARRAEPARSPGPGRPSLRPADRIHRGVRTCRRTERIRRHPPRLPWAVMTTTEKLTSPADARGLFRAGLRVPTAGWAPGHVQVNLIAVPKDLALHLVRFAGRNPKPCPLLEATEPGTARSVLAPGADLRTDVPAYRVWRDGECLAETTDVTEYWRDDLVTLLLGCSFTFERGLLRAGVPIRHLEQDRDVPTFPPHVARPPPRPRGGPSDA